ncbi:MAG TPA: hypothetical protein EYP59_01305 [Thiotrichaceae bacterium]|nr:hypothetical protein [Thiotrichaceae bacterium]
MNLKSPIEVLKDSNELSVFSIKIGETEKWCDLERRRHPLLIHFADEICPAYVVSLYQPSHKLFWWSYAFSSAQEFNLSNNTHEHSDNNQVVRYLSENQIVRFALGDGALWIKTSSSIRYNSIEEAFQKVLFILEKNLTELEENFYKWSTVLVFEDISEYFFRLEEDTFSAMPRFFGRIVSVAKINSLWHVQLEGTYNRKATLILKDKRENIEDPLLLTDEYYKNSWVLMRRNAYYLERGLPIPDYRYELLDVLIEDGSQK